MKLFNALLVSLAFVAAGAMLGARVGQVGTQQPAATTISLPQYADGEIPAAPSATVLTIKAAPNPAASLQLFRKWRVANGSG